MKPALHLRCCDFCLGLSVELIKDSRFRSETKPNITKLDQGCRVFSTPRLKKHVNSLEPIDAYSLPDELEVASETACLGFWALRLGEDHKKTCT